MQYNQSVR